MLVYYFSSTCSYIHCTDSCIALWRAEFHVWPCGSKCFAAVFTYLQTGIVIGQHQLLIILDRIVDGWLGIGCRGYITFPICRSAPFILIISYPVWTGVLKDILHCNSFLYKNYYYNNMSVCIFKQLFYHLHYFYLVLFPALPVLLQSFSP